MNYNCQEISGRISGYIIENFKVNSTGFDDKTELFHTGIIDSLGIPDLIAFIETTFEIRLADRYFFDKRFSNINGLVSIIEEILRQEAGS